MSSEGFDADGVVRVALELLDEVGLGGFTMRALATRLGTYPSTIYWHVGTRGVVLSEVGELVLQEAAHGLPDPRSTPWDDWLAINAHSYRRAMQAHPEVASWVVTHFEARVPVPWYLESILVSLAQAGFHGAGLVAAYNTYLGSLAGWVGIELIADDPGRGSDPESMRSSFDALSAQEFPTIGANRDHLSNRAFTFRWDGGASNPLDDAFDFAVRTWVEGLRVMLEDT